MKTKLLCVSIIGFGILTAAFILGIASAQTATDSNDADIQYPIAELGNCQNKEACKIYCDSPAHLAVCIAYAQKNNLMSEDEIDVAKKFLNAGAKGPGGCTGQESCETYCDDIGHINECVAFAERTGMLPPQELEEAKQVQAAIAKGVEPPPCKNKKECDVYCDDPSHMKVCVAFGEAAGFLKGQELQDAKKMMAAIDRGATPPPCKGKEACDAYCSEPEHMEVCMTFAQAAGFMSPQEAQDSEKALAAIKKGVKPPACRGKDECDKYCVQKEHFEECMNFAVAAGFMSEKDAEMARKTGGKGPGGCAGKEECDAFCNNLDNQQACFNFAKDNGLISSEELKKMEEGQKRFQESFQNMPTVVLDCLKTSLGIDLLEKLKGGQIMPSQAEGEKMGQCFSQMGGPPGQGQGTMPGGPGAGGSIPPAGQGMLGSPGAGQSFGTQGLEGQMSPGSPIPTAGIPPISSMPAEVQDCIKSAIGADAFSQLQSGSMKVEDQAVLFASARDCFTKFGPPPSGTTMPPQGFEQPTMPQQGTMPAYQYASGTVPNMPPGSYQPPPGTDMQPLQGIQQPMMPTGQEGGTLPPPGSYPPPPSGSMPLEGIPPGTSPPSPPPASMNPQNLLGLIFKPFLSIFGF